MPPTTGSDSSRVYRHPRRKPTATSFITPATQIAEGEVNRLTALAAPKPGFCRSARSRQGFARCARRWRGLDAPCALRTEASIGAAGILERKERQTMLDRSLTPSLTV